jgi:hypothetical protein
MVNLDPEGSVSPYLLVGVLTRWSDVSLLGLGTGISWGNRRLLLEARLYGGTAINMPITIGFSL